MKIYNNITSNIKHCIALTLVILLTSQFASATGSLHEFTLEDKRALLDAHNQMRTQCATGQDGSQNGPTMAFQMQKVFWDPALEEMAKTRAQACYYGHLGGTPAIRAAYEDVKHLTSYNSEGKARSIYATENVSLYVQNPPASQYPTQAWVNAVTGWFEEARLYDWNSNTCYADTCGHWSQMCYEETRYIGCAVANCDSGIAGAPGEAYADGAMQLVCAYWPQRNPSRKPYRQTVADLPFCMGSNYSDSKVCRDNLSSGGKSTEFISSGRINNHPNQCEDGLGRVEGLCNKEDDTSPPGPIKDLRYQVVNGKIQLSWTPAQDDYGITAYEILRRHNGQEEYLYALGSQAEYRDETTPSSGLVDYMITPVDANFGEGPVTSITANPQADGIVTDVQPPSNPNWILWNRIDQNVTLTWRAATDNKGIDYYVLVDELGEELATPHLMMEIGDLPVRKQHKYRIHAVDTSGNRSSGYPFEVYFSTIDNQDTRAPQAPISFAGELKGLQIYLSWQAAAEDGGKKFYLYRDSKLIANTDKLSFTDVNVESTTSYLYELVSIDESGNKSITKTITINTL